MKKFLAVLLSACLLIGCLAGCGTQTSDNGKPTVVTTIFPLYDWAKIILGEQGENYNLTYLLDSGADLHNFQPTAQDIALISSCALFVYIGGESDEWVEDLISAGDGNLNGLCMMDSVSTLEEAVVEGMQAEEEEEETAADEHIWLSLRRAQDMVKALCEALCGLDSANADTFRANAETYTESLAKLDQDYAAMRAEAKNDTILVADRFPFRYLAEDYDLNYYAAFPGCAAASDVSFETVSFLSEKLKELQLPAVLIIDGGDGKIAETVTQTAATGAKILTLDSCQCVSETAVAQGACYYDCMVSNLEILREALG